MLKYTLEIHSVQNIYNGHFPPSPQTGIDEPPGSCVCYMSNNDEEVEGEGFGCSMRWPIYFKYAYNYGLIHN